MTNFDFLLSEKDFSSFAETAVSAEKILHIDPAACVLNCRRAMELAIKWMYAVDAALTMPYDDRLVVLMDNSVFREIVGPELLQRMKLIRTLGNNAAHSGKKITREQAELCLENLFVFLDFVAYCYAENYTEGQFNKALLKNTPAITVIPPQTGIELERLMDENTALREQLSARREIHQSTYMPKPLDLSEYQTRKIYVDAMLLDSGWTEGKDWLCEVALPGMPNSSGTGYADYVLYDDSRKPLALIEAKRSCLDVSSGRQQAKLYADLLQQKYGRRPVIFLTNGFETHIDDGVYPERGCAAIYAKRDLEKLFHLRAMRTSLKNAVADRSIAGRYYQQDAIRAVCDSLSENRRKALLVMATGSGKTRTVIGLCDVLLRHGWAKNILFLADRSSLVTQAKRSFVKMLPAVSVTNLCEESGSCTAPCVFSTYQVMMRCIDTVKDAQGKLFTCGHFDLVICDEAHRSIYNKYRDIFTYFDAPLVGLTATPKEEVEKSTYEVFALTSGVPTYVYEPAQAVQDGYLVDFTAVETKLKFIEQGIAYDDLSAADQAAYEDTFLNENGELPGRISSSALNEWVFNEDTIREALHILMTHGLRINCGETLGKTIIFAGNHTHAEKIYAVFNKEYPQLAGHAKVIDGYMTYAQSSIDEFSDPGKLPQIAISVDMLDTGIDVPQVLNLVFFRKVMSRAKFWQMIGRGTRPCPGLMDGADKDRFYIFDFCGNFEFFRVNKGRPSACQAELQSTIFYRKAQIIRKLQALAFQTKDLITFRQSLVENMLNKVRVLNRENFAVRQHWKYVEQFSLPESYASLSHESTLTIRDEVAPLIPRDEEDCEAIRFDALMYSIELACLGGKEAANEKNDLLRKVTAIAGIANIPEVKAQSGLIQTILCSDYLDRAGILEFEHIRKNLRSLTKYIPPKELAYTTNFDDEVLSIEWTESKSDEPAS